MFLIVVENCFVLDAEVTAHDLSSLTDELKYAQSDATCGDHVMVGIF